MPGSRSFRLGLRHVSSRNVRKYLHFPEENQCSLDYQGSINIQSHRASLFLDNILRQLTYLLFIANAYLCIRPSWRGCMDFKSERTHWLQYFTPLCPKLKCADENFQWKQPKKSSWGKLGVDSKLCYIPMTHSLWLHAAMWNTDAKWLNNMWKQLCLSKDNSPWVLYFVHFLWA